MSRREFDRLLESAQRAQAARDDSFLQHRLVEDPPAWDYAGLVRERFAAVQRLLDLDTGDGDRLAAMAPLPAVTVATEPWPPNVQRAKGRLGALGVHLVHVDQEADNAYGSANGNHRRRLPLADGTFDLIICRHGSFAATEVARLLKPGGWLIAQLVGDGNTRGLSDALDGQPVVWSDLSRSRPPTTLEKAGLAVLRREEDKPRVTFLDIGAAVYYLLTVPWQIADFSIEVYRDRLLRLHERMLKSAGLHAHSHRKLVVARRP